MSLLAEQRGYGVREPVDHVQLREAHRIGLNLFDTRCSEADVQADIRVTREWRVFVGDGDTRGLVILRELQALLQLARPAGGRNEQRDVTLAQNCRRHALRVT